MGAPHEASKRVVRSKYPFAMIKPIGIRTFQVFDGSEPRSHMTKTAEEAWISAAHIIEVNKPCAD